MVNIRYCVMDPTGNTTILVETPVPVLQQPSIAARLMELLPEAEQVGFLSLEKDCDIALRMAGGEFCGNASMCAAAYAVMNGLAGGKDVTLHVSGAVGSVRAEVKNVDEGVFDGTVDMPRPLAIEKVVLPGAGELPVVRFDGIVHIILENLLPRDQAESYVRTWCRYLHADAAGLMFFEREKGNLTPLVYVPAADTLFWESSCASGTSAVGAFLADEAGESVTVKLHQPGGSLTVEASGKGELRLSGRVRFLGRKNASFVL